MKKVDPAILIAFSKMRKDKGKEEPADDMESGDDEMKLELAKEVLSALKAEDPEALANALSDFMACCSRDMEE